MHAFTPAPWHWEEDSRQNAWYLLSGREIILDSKPFGAEGNVSLIAAAPEMYDALATVLAASQGVKLPVKLSVALDDARAALAKAAPQ